MLITRVPRVREVESSNHPEFESFEACQILHSVANGSPLL